MRCVLGLLVFLAPPLAAQASAQPAAPEAQVARQAALGIGGLFVRARDPAALSAWYEKHLGINPVPQSYDDKPWVQEAGPTIFSPMPEDAQGMIPDGKSWMLNLRVADIDAFVAQLEADGIAVALDPKTYPNGRFATLSDPEGNPIQLWEPAFP
ncbi:MAG: VOC family protein [Erythrobacter sp.]|uniref:VOC family protein n=1 Tax=Erythrobacter sp. TaxID=1042 RepID=UPI002617388B|nr:VOC family protein [Erythrobacter sp.]MDJ0979578.1 VOC family protein [Erythrobacter sp.]